MREIVLDTETTGFDPRQGHRMVEIGCIELENLTPTGRTFHTLINPDRIIEAEELLSPVQDRAVRPRDLTEGWSFADDTTRATLVLDPEADWVPEDYPVVATRPLPDGRVEVDLDVADEAWLRRLVLRLAPHARVLAPEDFTHGLVSSAREALRHYEGPA